MKTQKGNLGSRLGKIGVISLLSVCVLVSLVAVFSIVMLWMDGDVKDAVAFLGDDEYTVGKANTTYALFKKGEDFPIVENVVGYYTGTPYSYILTRDQYVIINEEDGSYEIKDLNSATDEDRRMLEKVEKLDE